MSKKKEKEKWFIPFVNLVIHAVLGLAYFMAFMVPAVIIYKANEWLAEFGVKGFTMALLYGAESILMLFDFYMICRYIYQNVKKEH